MWTEASRRADRKMAQAADFGYSGYARLLDRGNQIAVSLHNGFRIASWPCAWVPLEWPRA